MIRLTAQNGAAMHRSGTVRLGNSQTTCVSSVPDPLFDAAKLTRGDGIFKNLTDKQCDAVTVFLEGRNAPIITSVRTASNIETDVAKAVRSDSVDSMDAPIMDSREGTHDGHHDDHHGGHHEKEESIVTAVAAGLINYCMMFGFCCAYGIIIFTDSAHERHRTLGIKMNLATAALMGLLLACSSKIPIAMGGPDMNPVLFTAVFVDKISEHIRNELALNVQPSRKLGASAGVDESFCTGAHYTEFRADCEDYHEQLRATTIVAVSIATAALALVFLILGYLKLTRYIAYVPTSIIDAFISCMGYKVFKYGLKLCKYDPKIFMPSAAVGVPLYFLKAHHIGNPAVVIPLFVATPIVIFYIIIYASGGDIESARKDKLMFSLIEYEGFWTIWTDSFFNSKAIQFKALAKCWSDVLVMIVVCTLDCLVTALRTTETKIPIKIDKCFENQLYGLGNVAAALCGSSAGYMQLKFNVINYGIMHNVKDRRAGLIYALACAITFFGPISVINYLPRLFLGTLLFFGGSGFVAEHLWGSREYLSFLEWMQVLIIVVIFIWFGILYAVLVGSLLCGITFIAKYAKIPCIAGHPMRGGEIQSREQHSPLVELVVQHVLSSWLLVVRLKGFIFFASVQSITKDIRRNVEREEEEGLPKYRRLRFVLLDCELLDGLDSSAEKDLQQLVKDLKKLDVRVLWSDLKEEQVDYMVARGTISKHEDAFVDMDSALLYVQGLALQYRRNQQVRWADLHPAFDLSHQLIRLRDSFEPFVDILGLDIERFGCPWEFASIVKIRKYKTLLWNPGEFNRQIFLIHTGAVGIFSEIPGKDGKGELERPIAVYRHGWFLNREAFIRAATRHYALALEDGELMYWTSHDWCRMHREQPLMASAILEAAMRQSSSDMERMVKQLRSCNNAVLEEEASQKHRPFSRATNENVRKSIRAQLATDEADALPHLEDLDGRLEGILVAQHLENFGLYARIPSNEAGMLPDLPRLIHHDLEVAYITYCEQRNGERGVPWEKVTEALMYAGIFNMLLVSEKRIDLLSQEQFVQLAHEAVFMRLSNKQVVKLYTHFCKDLLREDNLIPRDILVKMLNDELLPNVSEQEVNGIAQTWEDDGSGMISVAEFIGIVSRFLRRHEQDWNLLRGIRDCLTKTVHVDRQTTRLTPEKMVAYSEKHPSRTYDPLTKEQAEEMLWSAGCYTTLPAEKQGQYLEWAGVAAAVLVNVDQPCGKLPPKPKREHDDVEFHHPRTLRQSITQHMEERRSTTKSLELRTDHHLAAEHKRWLPRRESGHGFADGALAHIAETKEMEFNKQTSVQPSMEKVNSLAPSPRDMIVDSCSFRDFMATKSKDSPRPAPDLKQPKADATKGVSKIALKIGKAKVLRAARNMVNAAASEALDQIGLEHYTTPMTGIVMDLRNKPPSAANAGLFQKTRLSVYDWSAERNLASIRHKKNVMVTQNSKIPDTPDAKIYQLLEDPESSFGANVFSVFMGACIIGSVATLLAKSLIAADETKISDTQKMVWKVLECCFTIAFMSEYVVRFAVCTALGTQTYLDFLMRPLNICDVLSFTPFFLEMMFDHTEMDLAALLRVARLLRLARVARLARLTRNSAIFGPCAAIFTIVWGIYLKDQN